MKAIVLRVWEYISNQITASRPGNDQEEETWLGI